MSSAKRQERKLKIIACRAVYTGRNTKGHEYTIYEVDAAREDGRLINEKLRAFKALPVGQVLDLTIEPFVREARYELHAAPQAGNVSEQHESAQ